jgi:iron complex transport system ATP-binding protein
MYEAHQIAFRTQGRTILDGISLQVKPGAFTAIVGPNGAGKSTLLKVLAHEHRPSQGTVNINGQDIDSYSPRELAHVRAVLPQTTTVQFAFTVAQVIALGRHGRRALPAEDRAVCEAVMTVTGTLAFRDRQYQTLSGGEKQRVQLARVLAQVWDETVYPRYILLDEPTSSLDIAQQQYIFHLVRTVCRRNIGVMAIVHDLNQAVQYADALYFLRDGQVVANGPAGEVFTKSNIEETFRCRVHLYRDPVTGHPYIIPASDPAERFIAVGK